MSDQYAIMEEARRRLVEMNGKPDMMQAMIQKIAAEQGRGASGEQNNMDVLIQQVLGEQGGAPQDADTYVDGVRGSPPPVPVETQPIDKNAIHLTPELAAMFSQYGVAGNSGGNAGSGSRMANAAAPSDPLQGMGGGQAGQGRAGVASPEVSPEQEDAIKQAEAVGADKGWSNGEIAAAVGIPVAAYLAYKYYAGRTSQPTPPIVPSVVPTNNPVATTDPLDEMVNRATLPNEEMKLLGPPTGGDVMPTGAGEGGPDPRVPPAGPQGAASYTPDQIRLLNELAKMYQNGEVGIDKIPDVLRKMGVSPERAMQTFHGIRVTPRGPRARM